jgi:hypothetical protein
MFTFSTSGMMCLPMLIQIHKRILSEITYRIPDDGCMTITYKMFEETARSKLTSQLT